MGVVLNAAYAGAYLWKGEDPETQLVFKTVSSGTIARGDLVTLTNDRLTIYQGSSVTDDTSAATGAAKIFGVAMAPGDATEATAPARIPVMPIRVDHAFRMCTGDSTTFTAAKVGAVAAIGGTATGTHKVLLGRTGLTTDLLGPVRIVDVVLPTTGAAQGNGLQYVELFGPTASNKDAAARLAALTTPTRVEVIVKFQPGVLQS